MVDQQETDVVGICQLLQAGDHIVIAGVAVFSGHLPDFLEGIRDYQDGVRVFSQEVLQLLVQVLPHLPGMGGKVQVVTAFHAEHPGHTLLEPLLVILQCQVQDGAAMNPTAPEIGAGTDPVGNLGPLEFLKKVRGIRKVFIELSVCFCYTRCVYFGRLPSICANRWVPGGRFFCKFLMENAELHLSFLVI